MRVVVGRRQSVCIARSSANSTATWRRVGSAPPNTRRQCWRCSGVCWLRQRSKRRRPPATVRAPLIAAIVLVPVMALALYLPWGSPDMPAEPLAARVAAVERSRREEAALIDQLRQKIAALDPKSEQARAGLVLLGNVEDQRGNLPGAAEAWRRALVSRFDPTLAAQTAEAISRVAGRVTPEAVHLFQEALAQGATDAPWRGLVEQRLKEADGAAP